MSAIRSLLDAIASIFIGLLALYLLLFMLSVSTGVGRFALQVENIRNTSVSNNWLSRGWANLELTGATITDGAGVRTARCGGRCYLEVPFVGWWILPNWSDDAYLADLLPIR